MSNRSERKDYAEDQRKALESFFSSQPFSASDFGINVDYIRACIEVAADGVEFEDDEDEDE